MDVMKPADRFDVYHVCPGQCLCAGPHRCSARWSDPLAAAALALLVCRLSAQRAVSCASVGETRNVMM